MGFGVLQRDLPGHALLELLEDVVNVDPKAHRMQQLLDEDPWLKETDLTEGEKQAFARVDGEDFVEW